LARVRSRFGRVDGVIHAAGQLSDAPIGTKSLDEAMTVIAPKVVGAQNLSALCPEGSLDLFAVFSSTSALNGPPGQIDYAAANAFLEAFAATRSDGICLTWGPWFETGMTARLASGHSGHRSHAPHDEAGPGIPDAAPGTPVAPGTPLLGSPVPGQNDRERTYARWLDPGEEWSLAEHRMGDTFVLPGTAFIETARSAALSCDLELPLVLEELHFLTPVAMPPGTSRRLITRVETVGAGKAAKLARRLGFARGERRIEITQAGEDGEEVIAFTCRAHTATTAQSPISVTTPPTSAVPMIATPSAQTAGIDFGPRWNCVRAVKTRMSEVFAELRLPAEYETELGERPLHPALLDMAATIGLHLISRARRERYLFVPETVESVVIRAPLTSPCFAYAVQTGGDNAARGCFDVTIGLPDKPASVVIRGLRMRGLDRNAGQAFEFAGIGTGSAPTASPLGKILSLGLRAGEAGEIFERAFAAETRNVVVSPVRLSDLERVYEAMSTGPAAASAGTEMQVGRRRATGTQTTPADPTEAFVTGLFKELLGLEDVPPDASFLDLGGHSLAAVRMFARIRKKTGVDLPVSTLLEAPGVRALAALIREKDGTPEGPEETVVTVASTLEAAAARPTALEPSGEQSLRAAKEAGTGWSPTAVKPVSRMKAVDRGGTGHRPLVKIASGPDGRVPVFWVHGADGNVISGKPMSDHLTQPRTIWGLQAQGVDGRLPPLEKIEDMASRYLDAVMQVQRDGPICLVGFSGGGVIAYEMAQQLTATGTRPELLAMIDTLAPESSGRASLFDYLAYGRFLGLKRSWSLVRSGWRSHFSAYANPWKRDIINEFEIDDPLIDNTEKVFAAYLRAQSRYATLPYDGPVVLFRAGQPGLRFHAAGEHLGWGAHVRGGIRIHTVAADHDNIVKEPAVRDLARVLEAEMLTIDRLAATSGKPVASMLNIR